MTSDMDNIACILLWLLRSDLVLTTVIFCLHAEVGNVLLRLVLIHFAGNSVKGGSVVINGNSLGMEDAYAQVSTVPGRKL